MHAERKQGKLYSSKMAKRRFQKQALKPAKWQDVVKKRILRGDKIN
jgi:hypothetical protein